MEQFLNNSILFAITILTFSLFLYHQFIWKPKRQLAKKPPPPPEASGAWPIIGHLHLLGGPQPPHKVLGQMADKHGPIFTIRMGVHRALVVSNWEIAKECLTTNDKNFANRPKTIAAEILTYDYAMFGFSPYGPYWRQVRKISTVELLSNHRLETHRHIRESEVKTAIKELYDDSHNNKEVEMKKWFGDITLNIVFRIVVGKRYLEATAASESESGDRGNRHRKALRDFFEFTGSFMVSDAIPWLRWLDLGGHEKAMKKTMRELDQVAQRWLDDHKRQASNNNTRDFMDVMLSILGDEEFEDPRYDNDTIIKAMSMAMILAASDTTTVTMTWALALLLNNREALTKLHQELDQHVGRQRPVNESDIKNLVYLQATVKETLRLYPAGPLSIPHESMEDCTVAGHHIPARTRLLVNLAKLHRDPNVWARPEEFVPERFLNSDVDIRGQNYELLPFSTGRRMCPGVSFALQVIQLSLAAVLQSFDFATPSNEPVDMTGSAGLTNLKASPFRLLLTPRLPPEAY